MHQIIIIGTIPPCPRCKLLTEIVTVKAKLLKLDADVRHISYTSEDAAELAGKVNLLPGTAKDVAKLIGREINLENMPKSAESKELGFLNELEANLKQFEGLFREVNILDNWLRPFENQAKDVGILMTPVLIINGSIRHNGSVPDLALIDGWLSELE
ncbi:hypothetical protein MASR2M70_21460 [Bacillota bacterium]